MTVGSLLGDLGKNLAERWLSLLVLPGALYLAVATGGHVLGHAHPFDADRLARQITAWAKAPAMSSAGGQAVLLVTVLGAAAGAGLVAQALGSALERLTLAAGWRAWPAPLRRLAGWRVDRRRSRWNGAAAAYRELRETAARTRAAGQRTDGTARHAARRAMMRIATEQPDRPTWSGDRLHAVATRLDRDRHLDLASLWPHLWLSLPDPVRTEVTVGRQALSRATTLGGWALLYAPLMIWWWPAALLALVLACTARGQTRKAADTYALLLEAAVTLHTGDLARQLGIDHTGPVTPDTGDALSAVLHRPRPGPS
ncbi:hypothetical protein [Streptomyces sp. NPDC048385]|uniref:hypothetical protein n=1 Tax=unclassified Streptomyces TaxID=2593676 RepID=UPI00342DCB92